MAKTWEEMSKEERDATGQTKKEYNRSEAHERTETHAKKEKTGTGAHATEGLSSWDSLNKDEREATGQSKKEYNRRTEDGSPSKYEIKTDVKGGSTVDDLVSLDKSGTVTDNKAQTYLNKKIRQMSPVADATPAPSTPSPTPTTPTPTTPTPTPTPSTPSPTPSVPSNPNVPPGGGNPYNPGNPVVDNSPVNNEANVDQNQELSNENNSTNIIDGNHNSIDNRQYSFGGNQSTTIFQQGHSIGGGHGGNNFVDTAASQMALARSTDYDSPSDTAEFVTRHSAINDMVQNKTPNYAQASIDNARSNKVVDTVALDTRISQRPLYMDAQSKMMGLNLFGDTFKFQPPTWESGLGTGDPADKPDLEGIADDIKDDIDDI